MAKNSRRKGKAGELEAAAELRRCLGVTARRGQQFSGGSDSPDVVTSLDGVHFEVKRTESLNLYTALAQAIDEADGKVPVLLHRRSRRPWVAVVRLDDLMRLADKLLHHVP